MKDIVERIRGLRFVHVPIASGLMEEAAKEIERVRLELSVQRSCTVAGREEIARLRLTDEERENDHDAAHRANIVDQLRDRAYCGKGVDSLCERAATEIERLLWAEKTSKNVIDRLMKNTPPPPCKERF